MERVLVLVEIDTDLVRNVIIADDDYVPTTGLTAIEAPGARIGWLWNGGDQIPAEEPLE